MASINIAHVSIKQSDTNFDLVTFNQFFKIPQSDRNDLIKHQRIEFIDSAGSAIKLIDGLKSIAEFIKQLREEGKYNDFLSMS